MALPINIEDLITGRTVEWERIEFKKGWNPVGFPGKVFKVFTSPLNRSFSLEIESFSSGLSGLGVYRD